MEEWIHPVRESIIQIIVIKKVVLVVIVTNRIITVAPVSYTHLDVYKRQILISAFKLLSSSSDRKFTI